MIYEGFVNSRRCSLTLGRPRVYRAWIQRLKLKYHEALSKFAFKFNVRGYNLVKHFREECNLLALVGRRRLTPG